MFRWLESPVPTLESELTSSTSPDDLELPPPPPPHPNCDMSASSQSISSHRASLPNHQSPVDSRVSLPSPYIHRDSKVSLPSPYMHRDSRVSLPSLYTQRDTRVSRPSVDSRGSLPSPSLHRDGLTNEGRGRLTNQNGERESSANQKPVEPTKPKVKATGLQKKDSIYSRLAKKKPKSLTFSMPNGKLSRYERDRAIIQHSNLTVFPSKPLPLHNNNNNNNNNNNKKNGHEGSSKVDAKRSGGVASSYQPVGLCTMKEWIYRIINKLTTYLLSIKGVVMFCPCLFCPSDNFETCLALPMC